MRKHIGTLIIGLLAGLLCSITVVQAVSPTMTIQLVDHLGNVLGGIASATSASANATAQVINSAGNVLDSLFVNPTTGGIAYKQLPSPSNITVTHTGTSGATTVCYKVSAIDVSNANTLPCGTPGTSPAAQVCGTTEICDTTANASQVTTPETIAWSAVTGAYGYNVYGRTSGGELLMTPTPLTATTLNFIDNGSVTPSGTVPLINGTGQLPGAIDFGGTRGIGSLTTNAWNNVGTASIGVVNQNMKPPAGTYSLMVFCIAYVNNGAASANTFNMRITVDGADQIEEDGITIGATPARVPGYLQGNIIYTNGANPPAPSAVCQIFAPTGSTLSIAGDPGGGVSGGGPSTQIIGMLFPMFEE